MDRSFFVEFSKTVDLLNSAESKALTPIHRNVIDKGSVLSSMKFSEGHVLCTLFKLDRPITVARLAAHCSIMVNNISKPLRTLIEGGFVSETKDTADRRKIYIEITPLGRQTVSDFDNMCIDESATHLQSIFSDDELTRILEAMQVLCALWNKKR